MAEYKISQIMPNAARCSYTDYTQDVFNQLSPSEKEDLYSLSQSIGGPDGAVQLPVLEKLPKPVNGKLYRTRDGDRRIMATLVFLGKATVKARVKKFASSYRTTALAAQGQHRTLNGFDKLRCCYEAVADDGEERVAQESGIKLDTVRTYIRWWENFGPKAKAYCEANAERISLRMIGESMVGERATDDAAQLAYLKRKLGDAPPSRAAAKQTKRKSFKAASVTEALERTKEQMMHRCRSAQQRKLVEDTLEQFHAELAQQLKPKRKIGVRRVSPPAGAPLTAVIDYDANA